MPGISSKAFVFENSENNKNKFQDQELNPDLGVNYYEFKYRNHDAQIGRFIQIDPLANEYVYNSTYAFSENKVTTHVELEGLETWYINTKGMTSEEKDRFWSGFHQGLQESNEKNGKLAKIIGITLLMALVPEVGFPLAVAEITGVPVTPSPQAISGTVASELSAIENTTAEISTASKGVDLVVKAKSTWNASQIAQAEAKVEALTNAETVVTKAPVARGANLRSKFKAAGGQVNSTQHVDHIVDLQLGGTNATSNLQALDASVNTSLGKQLQLQTRNLPDNTRVNRVILKLPPKEQ